jgi:dihydrofolate reductase
VIVAYSVDEALNKALELNPWPFVIGGQRVYTDALPRTHALHLTLVEDSPTADTFFPAYKNLFRRVWQEKKGLEEGGIRYRWTEWRKR